MGRMQRGISFLLVVAWLGTACATSSGTSGSVAQEPAEQARRTLVTAVRVEPRTIAARVVGQNLSIASFLTRRHILGSALESGAEAILNHPHWTSAYVGLGPYRLDRWEPGAFLEATSFERHALGAPRVPRIKIMFMPDGNTALAAMLAGDVQFGADSALTSQQASALVRQWPTGAGSSVSQASLWRAAHAQARPDFVSPAALQDVRVRRALAYAVDRSGINELVYDGQHFIADSMFPPTSEIGRAADAAVTKYPLDLRQSAQLMAEAGFSRGGDGVYASPSGGRFSAEIRTTAGADSEAEMSAVASGWRQAGFDFQEATTPAALAQDVRARSTYPGIQLITAALGESGIINLATNNVPRPENNWRSPRHP